MTNPFFPDAEKSDAPPAPSVDNVAPQTRPLLSPHEAQIDLPRKAWIQRVYERWEGAIQITCMIVFPLVIGYYGVKYGNAVLERIEQSKQRQEYVRIASDILSQKASESEESSPIRKWAADVLQAYSPTPLEKSAKEDLISGKARTGGAHKYLMSEDGQIFTDEKGNPITTE